MEVYPELLVPLGLTVVAALFVRRQRAGVAWLFAIPTIYLLRQLAVSTAGDAGGGHLADDSLWVSGFSSTLHDVLIVPGLLMVFLAVPAALLFEVVTRFRGPRTSAPG
jgi:hypothetical protein